MIYEKCIEYLVISIKQKKERILPVQMRAFDQSQVYNLKLEVEPSSTQFPPNYTKRFGPNTGFNIKTNFPKMENKNKYRCSTKTGVTFETKVWTGPS